MMKKIVSILLLVALTLLALASCAPAEQNDIYSVANASHATAVNTEVTYLTKSGDNLSGWYEVKSEGNDAIIYYDFYRYQYPGEAALGGAETSRIVHNEGTTYYYAGKYYNADDLKAWVGAPSEATFIFNLKEENFTDTVITNNGRELWAMITPEACLEMLGFNLNANEDGIEVTIKTNGTYLVEISLSCTTVSGATMVVRSSYSYNELTLDFSDITGEE